MKAMILAAGFGTRLGSITQKTPKCLLEAGGSTMLELVVERLKTAGVDYVVINLHHLGSQVEDYVKERKNFGIEVQFSREDTILGTGGGVKHARRFLEDQDCFFIHNADVYCEFDPAGLIAAHRRTGAMATLAVLPCQTASFLCCDEEGRLNGWVNEETGTSNLLSENGKQSRVTFGGIHLASPKIFDFMAAKTGAFSIFTPYMEARRAAEEIFVYQLGEAFWIDVGTVEKWQALASRLGKGA